MKKIARLMVSAVLFLSSFVGFSQTSYAAKTGSEISNEKKQLVLQHARDLSAKNDGKSMITWHSSHYSHSSHGSHYSHDSHYSHYSSRW